jgi:hypothetical protein
LPALNEKEIDRNIGLFLFMPNLAKSLSAEHGCPASTEQPE